MEYQLLVDLDGDGTPETDILGDGRTGAGLRFTRGGKPDVQVIPLEAGVATCELDNRNGEWGKGSGLVKGRPVLVREVDFEGGPRDLWSGFVDTVRPVIAGRPDRTVIVTMYGGFSRMVLAGRISTALYQNVRTDQAIGIALDAIGFAGPRYLDVGEVTLAWWWADEEEVLVALRDIVTTEGVTASIYEARDGGVVFRNRSALFTDARSTEVQAIYGGDV